MSARATAARAKRRVEERRRSWADRLQDRLPRPARSLLERARSDDILLLAAALAFYAVVSVVPLVVLVTSLVSLVLGDERTQQFATQVGRLAPEKIGADQAVQRIADAGTRVSVVALLTGLWPASAYGSGLVRAFDRLSPHPDRPAKGIRGRSLALVFLLPLLVITGIVSSYLGSQLLGSGGPGRVAGLGVALVTGFVGAAVSLALIYRIFPPEPLAWRSILRGTLTTAASMSLLSLAFTAYLAVGANFQEHYATSGLASFVLLAVWLFLANTLVLVGYRVASEGGERSRPDE